MKKRILIVACALLMSGGISAKAATLTETPITDIVKDSTSVTDGEYRSSKLIGFIFKEEMDEASILHTGNIRINDSVDIIENIDIIDKRCLVITLKEEMQTDYRYIVEFYNIKTADGIETEYARFNTKIVDNYTGKALLIDEIKTTKTDTATTMTMPLILNTGTSDFTFYDIYATYNERGRYEDMQKTEITLKPDTYRKNITHTNTDKTKKSKMFIWKENQTPVCKEGTE